MSADATTLLVLAVLFLAALVRSALGFGEALVAVPLLALLVPVERAAPLAALLSVTVASAALIQDRQHAHAGAAWRLVLATALGIPLGVWGLTAAPERAVKVALGVLIVGFSAYCLAGRLRGELRDDRLAWAFGFGAGVLGGAYAMNGPPLAIYGALRRWPPEQFRATLQGYFLPASLLCLCGYALTGLWVEEVTRYYLLSLPLLVAAILLGRAANRRAGGPRFARCVHAGLILSGAALLLQAVWG